MASEAATPLTSVQSFRSTNGIELSASAKQETRTIAELG